MKNTMLTTPSGVTGTYPWLIRELAHHPTRFTSEDVQWLLDNQTTANPRWRVVLLIRDLGAQMRLPDAIVNLMMDGTPFEINNNTYVFDGVLVNQVSA